MSTKDFCFSSTKEKQQFFGTFSTISKNDTPRYDNFNLNNQNQKCSKIEFLQSSKNLTTENNRRKQNNYDSSNFYQSKIDTHFASSKPLNLLKKVETEKQQWKKNDTSFLNATKSNNNSTLSLHISAYENSVIASQKDESEKQNTVHKGWKNVQNFTPKIQSSFEFPRQQENSKNEPEIMQFKASQRLFNPNQLNIIFKQKRARSLNDGKSAFGHLVKNKFTESLSCSTLPRFSMSLLSMLMVNSDSDSDFLEQLNDPLFDWSGCDQDIIACLNGENYYSRELLMGMDMKGELHIGNEYCNGADSEKTHQFATLIIPKIDVQGVEKIVLYYQVISLADYKKVTEYCSDIVLIQIRVNDEKGTVPLNQLLHLTPEVISYDFEFIDTPLTLQTFNQLMMVDFEYFTWCSLTKVPDGFEIESFFEFMKKNKRVKFIIDFTNDLSPTYQIRVQNILNRIIKCLKSPNNGWRVPLLYFKQMPEESRRELNTFVRNE